MIAHPPVVLLFFGGELFEFVVGECFPFPGRLKMKLARINKIEDIEARVRDTLTLSIEISESEKRFKRVITYRGDYLFIWPENT